MNITFCVVCYRLKAISSNVDKVHDLLRLVVQKMEIKTEADDQDEAESRDMLPAMSGGCQSVTWSSPALRHTLLKQASVMAHWKNLDT